MKFVSKKIIKEKQCLRAIVNRFTVILFFVGNVELLSHFLLGYHKPLYMRLCAVTSLRLTQTELLLETISKAGWYASHLCPRQLPSWSKFLLERTQVSAQVSLLTLLPLREAAAQNETSLLTVAQRDGWRRHTV